MRSLELKGEDKLHTNDNVRKALVALCERLGVPCPPPKLFRKTSADLLYNPETFAEHHDLFLGHTPATVATKNYVSPGESKLDSAIRWLGQQYGIQ